MSIIIFDTETSGLPINNNFSNIRMLEIGYLILDMDLNIIKEKNFLSKIDIEVPEIITKLTGITSEKLKIEGTDIKKIFSILLEDITEIDIMIAHNNRFDLGVLRQEFKNIGAEKLFLEKIYKKIQLDSVQIFRDNIKKKDIENYKLQTIYKYLNQDDYIQTHRALDDCFMLHKSLTRLQNYNSYNYYLNKKFNFSKYPKQCLRDIYKKDSRFVTDFIKKLPISKNILKFLI